MSKASFEIAGIRFTDVDVGNNGMLSVKLPTCGEVMAYERGRAAGRAEAVAWLRELASEMHIKACMTGLHTTATLSMIQALTTAADELEARAKAPAERHDGGERE